MEKGFHFTKNRKFFFLFTAAVIVLGVVCMILRGFNLDVDFTGGTTVTVSDLGSKPVSDELQQKIISTLEAHDGVKVSSFQRTETMSAESGATTHGFTLKAQGLTDDAELRAKVEIELRTLLGDPDAQKEADKLLSSDLISTRSVGGTVSGELRTAAIVSALIAIVLMLVYITFRFDLCSGLSAVLCLAHDIFVILVFYSLLQIPMGSTMIAALLTILGYSINATIIVFDRIRENRRAEPDGDFDAIVNRSVRQTMRRSVFTSLTTLATIGALYVACSLANIPSVTNFALPIIVGIVAGLFSSTCLAGNLWSVLSRVIRIKRVKTK